MHLLILYNKNGFNEYPICFIKAYVGILTFPISHQNWIGILRTVPKSRCVFLLLLLMLFLFVLEFHLFCNQLLLHDLHHQIPLQHLKHLHVHLHVMIFCMFYLLFGVKIQILLLLLHLYLFLLFLHDLLFLH